MEKVVQTRSLGERFDAGIQLLKGLFLLAIAAALGGYALWVALT